MSKEKQAEIETTYKTMYTYTCPVRGVVTQEVMVKKFRAQSAPETKYVDSEIAELLGNTDENLDDLGFHEDIN